MSDLDRNSFASGFKNMSLSQHGGCQRFCRTNYGRRIFIELR